MIRRKGQFFIISAVIVVILLMSLTKMLSNNENQDTAIHLRDINDALRVLENNNYELFEMMSFLSDETMYSVMESYLDGKKILLRNRGYLMVYNINEIENTIEITYDINSIHMEQIISILEFNRISAWDFDEGVGVGTKDKTSSNDGELINFSWTKNSGWTDSCISGNCIVFDGIDDYVLINKTINLNSFSIEFWFKTKELGVGNRQGIFLIDGVNDIRLFINPNNLEFDQNPGELGNLVVPITLDNWVFIIATYDDTNNIAKIYLDGVLIETRNSISLDFNGIPKISWLAADNYFNGTIDNLRIYNTSLNAEQVQFLYNNGRN
ncbi:hypothetical protein GQ473_03555 [archaeon]|nr:hypothetical protein [archaeon]